MNAQQMYNLAFLFTTFPPEVTGSAIYNWERVQWLARQGTYRLLVLVPEWQIPIPSPPPELADRLRIETYPSRPWPLYKLLRAPTLAAARYIRQRVAEFEPDLITVLDIERLFWFGTWHLPGRRYAKQHQIPYISEYHTDYYNHLSTYPGGKILRNLLVKPISSYLYQQCDQTLAISAAACRSLKEIDVTNTHLLPMYGLDLTGFSPSYQDCHCFAPWLSPEASNHKIILFLGRLALEKRVEILIEAFAHLQTTHSYSQCSLIIAGDGPENAVNQLKQLAKPISHIHFTGFVEGATRSRFLASADVYCSPAPYETFGRTPIEAMASGTPVVTVNSGGVSDYIQEGINGYLVPPDDIKALSRTLEKTLQSKNTEMIQRAMADAMQFSLDQTCQNLDVYYQEILTIRDSSPRNLKQTASAPILPNQKR